MRNKSLILFTVFFILISCDSYHQKYGSILIKVDLKHEIIWNPAILLDGMYYSSVQRRTTDNEYNYLHMMPQESFDIPEDSKFFLIDTDKPDSKIIYLVKGESQSSLKPGDTVKALFAEGIQHEYLPSQPLKKADSTLINMVMELINTFRQMEGEGPDKTSSDSVFESEQQREFDSQLLTGTWSRSENENAFFFIKDDSVYYIDNQQVGYYVEILFDTLIFHLDGLDAKVKLIKLTQDSLVYESEYGMMNRLYNVSSRDN